MDPGLTPGITSTGAGRPDRDFTLLFVVMLTIAAGNTALQSVLPALGRSLKVPDSAVALAFSVSALVWVLVAPAWARRSDRSGRKRMVALGIAGFTLSLILCGLFLAAGVLGWISGTAALVAFIFARIIYGCFGAAAPPAAQAIVASRTGRGERTRALTLLASAFGLGTILGPAFAPFFVLPWVGLAGPAFVFAGFGAVVLWLVVHRLSDDAPDMVSRGAATSYPSIGGEGTGASIVAATAEGPTREIKLTDRRIWPWMVVGLVTGHAQAMASQAIGFLIIDRLGLPPIAAQQAIGIVLMTGAGATLLAQWGVIPLLDLSPRSLAIWGGISAAIGTALIGVSASLYAIAVATGIASLGFGFLRPAFTAGASLAVGADYQGAVAGRTTAVNGAAYVLGPSIGVGLYGLWGPLPYLAAGAALLVLTGYAIVSLRPSPRAESASPAQ